MRDGIRDGAARKTSRCPTSCFGLDRPHKLTPHIAPRACIAALCHPAPPQSQCSPFGHTPSHPGATDEAPRTCCLKLLIGNHAVGAVIGKGGATINEFQQHSGARLQLSRNNELFPGTTERVALITGDINAILTALHLIATKLHAGDEHAGPAGEAAPPRPAQTAVQLRLVVPNAACGAVIGRNGATIKAIVDDSGATVKASSADATPPGVTDRVITVAGEMGQCMRAVCLILQTCAEERSYLVFGNAVFTYGQAAAPLGMGLPLGMGMAAGHSMGGMAGIAGIGPAAAQLQTTMTVGVPDEHIGAVVGKAGKAITEIQVQTGVRIKISDRGDFLQGTTNRKVTIAGTTEGCQMAHFLICQKVTQNVQDMAQRARQMQQQGAGGGAMAEDGFPLPSGE